MALEQWSWLAPRRFGRYFIALLRGYEDDFPVEEDPVGEFLSRREGEAGQSEDEEDPMPAMATPELQAAEVGSENIEIQGMAVDNREQSMDKPEQAAEDSAEPSLDGNEERVARLADEARGVALADVGPEAPEVESERFEMAETTDAEAQIPEVESESVEMAETTDAEPRTLEVESQSAEAADTAQREEAPEEEVDSLLDVFKSEQDSENPISALSRELSDTSVYSLLEEMKRIAEKVRKRS